MAGTRAVLRWKRERSSLAARTDPPGPQAAAEATLCYVGGELLSFGACALTSAYHYNLTYLYRGLEWTTNAAHLSGATFLRLDSAVAKIKPSKSWASVLLTKRLLSSRESCCAVLAARSSF